MEPEDAFVTDENGFKISSARLKVDKGAKPGFFPGNLDTLLKTSADDAAKLGEFTAIAGARGTCPFTDAVFLRFFSVRGPLSV